MWSWFLVPTFSSSRSTTIRGSRHWDSQHPWWSTTDRWQRTDDTQRHSTVFWMISIHFTSSYVYIHVTYIIIYIYTYTYIYVYIYIKMIFWLERCLLNKRQNTRNPEKETLKWMPICLSNEDTPVQHGGILVMIPHVASSTALLSILKSKHGTCAGHTKVDATGPWGFSPVASQWGFGIYHHIASSWTSCHQTKQVEGTRILENQLDQPNVRYIDLPGKQQTCNAKCSQPADNLFPYWSTEINSIS